MSRMLKALQLFAHKGGEKQLHWNLLLQFAYSLYTFYGATMMIKGRLQVIKSNVKAVFV